MKSNNNNNYINNTKTEANIQNQLNELENIQKEIMEHFQTEINLKKKIIEKEDIIEKSAKDFFKTN